jgi:hypothetical protein
LEDIKKTGESQQEIKKEMLWNEKCGRALLTTHPYKMKIIMKKEQKKCKICGLYTEKCMLQIFSPLENVPSLH